MSSNLSLNTKPINSPPSKSFHTRLFVGQSRANPRLNITNQTPKIVPSWPTQFPNRSLKLKNRIPNLLHAIGDRRRLSPPQAVGFRQPSHWCRWGSSGGEVDMEGGESQRLGVGLDLAGVHRQRIVTEARVWSSTAGGSDILCICSDSGRGFGDSWGGGEDLGLIGNDEEKEEKEYGECLEGRKMGILHCSWFGSGYEDLEKNGKQIYGGNLVIKDRGLPQTEKSMGWNLREKKGCVFVMKLFVRCWLVWFRKICSRGRCNYWRWSKKWTLILVRSLQCKWFKSCPIQLYYRFHDIFLFFFFKLVL